MPTSVTITQVEVFQGFDSDELTEKINKFGETHTIKDVKLNVEQCPGEYCSTLYYIFTVMYEYVKQDR